MDKWEQRWEHLQLILEVYQFARDASVAEAWLAIQEGYFGSGAIEELGFPGSGWIERVQSCVEITVERRGTGIATPSSRRRVDGVEVDATIQRERAVKF